MTTEDDTRAGIGADAQPQSGWAAGDAASADERRLSSPADDTDAETAAAPEVTAAVAGDAASIPDGEVERIRALGSQAIDLGSATTVDELADHVDAFQRLHAELRDAMAAIDSA